MGSVVKIYRSFTHACVGVMCFPPNPHPSHQEAPSSIMMDPLGMGVECFFCFVVYAAYIGKSEGYNRGLRDYPRAIFRHRRRDQRDELLTYSMRISNCQCFNQKQVYTLHYIPPGSPSSTGGRVVRVLSYVFFLPTSDKCSHGSMSCYLALAG